MKVICPKCQFENQADSTRIVCARCATIIEVNLDQDAGLEVNGKRQTARLPFAANSGNNHPLSSQSTGSQPLDQPRDVYATRIGDDFDDVLEIERPSQPGYQSGYEPSSVYDDVFATPGYDSPSPYDYSPVERKISRAGESYPTGVQRQRDTQDYVAAPEPEFMGWPVLPENSIEDEEPVTGFSRGRGGLLASIVLGALVFGGLVFGAYYFLGDLISKRKDQADNLVGTNNASGNQTSPGTAVPAPSVENKAPVANPSQPVVPPPGNNSKPKESPGTNTDNSSKPPPGKIVDIPPDGPNGPSKTPKIQVQTPIPNTGNLTVQVASYKEQSQANERSNRLKAAGVDASVVKAEIPGQGTYYRVQIGGFATREAANNFGNQLKNKGTVEVFIVTTKGK